MKSVDLSRAHLLDHTMKDCHGYYGGRRQHLWVSWKFVWRMNLRINTTCRVGWHVPTQMWHAGDTITACRYCLQPATRHH